VPLAASVWISAVGEQPCECLGVGGTEGDTECVTECVWGK
jgi:hypothetical protein